MYCLAILGSLGMVAAMTGQVHDADDLVKAIMMIMGFVLLATAWLVLSLIFSRIGLETVIVLFRIETNTRTLKERAED